MVKKKKSIIIVNEVNNGGGYEYMVMGVFGKTFFQYCCKTSIKVILTNNLNNKKVFLIFL